MSVDPQNERILLIGVNGQLGWELRRSLAPLGDLVCAARRREGDGLGREVLPVDLAEEESLAALVQSVRPRLIVNATAYSAVDQAEREPEAAMAVNGRAPGVLQAAANVLGAAVVHYSTDYVFDGGGSRPWTETDPTGPLNTYGRTKLAGEQAMAAAGGAFWIFRTSWVYGVHGANFVKKILKFAAERKQLRIVADQIGAPTSARFLAEATAALLRQADGDYAAYACNRGGIFHLSCGGATSWHGFTERIVAGARRAGMALAVEAIDPIPTSEFPTPAARPLNSRLDGRKFSTTFGITPPAWEIEFDAVLPDLLGYEFGSSAHRQDEPTR
jgi:dTDP-4-dehydrorhamnose reductase